MLEETSTGAARDTDPKDDPALRAPGSPGGEDVTPGEVVEHEVAEDAPIWDDAVEEAAESDKG